MASLDVLLQVRFIDVSSVTLGAVEFVGIYVGPQSIVNLILVVNASHQVPLEIGLPVESFQAERAFVMRFFRAVHTNHVLSNGIFRRKSSWAQIASVVPCPIIVMICPVIVELRFCGESFSAVLK